MISKELLTGTCGAIVIMPRKSVPASNELSPSVVTNTLSAKPLVSPELNGVFLAEVDRGSGCPHPDPSLAMRIAQRRGQTRWVGRDRIKQQSATSRHDREMILGESNLLPFDFLRAGDKVGRAVVKIQRGDGAAGTGFLVAPDILLTNNHVLADPASAQSAYALANYERQPPDDPTGFPAVARLKPQTLFVTSTELDFTFVAVEGIDFLGAVPIDRDSLNVIEKEYVNLIQHPRGRPKEIAVQDSQIIRADSLVAQYSCDTEPGSSGSPVFNNQWQLVALHHASVLADDLPPRPVAADSSIKALATGRYLNEGIRLSAIAVWLETYEPSTPEERQQIDRLRGIVHGLDPQIGFFGALGHEVHGKSAAQIVDESYRGATAKLDIALWNLRGLEGVIRGGAEEFARIVSDMRMDIWIFASPDPEAIEGLSQDLKTQYGLDYHVIHSRDTSGRMVSILQDRARGLELHPVAWPDGVCPALGSEAPLCLKAMIPWAKATSPEVRIVPLFWSSWATAPATDLPWVQSIAVQTKQNNAADWLIFGSRESLLSPDNLLALSGNDDRLVVVADEGDGAFAMVHRADSGISRIYASSCLIPALGHPDHLIVALDRELPSTITSWGGHAPIAVRLSLKDMQHEVMAASPRKRKRGKKT